MRCFLFIELTYEHCFDEISGKLLRINPVFLPDQVVLPLPGAVSHVGVSCDGLTVSVVVRLDQFLSCLLYDTRALLKSPTTKPLSRTELNTTSSAVPLTGLVWNPALPNMFCTSWLDGSLALYTVTAAGETDCLSLPPATGVRALDWSPRGKQLVVIKQNCELVQYKPDLSVPKYPKLQEMKKIPGPEKAGLEGVSVCWLSTHEFLVGVREGENLSCWLVTGSKAGPVTHTDYDDPCYSTGGAGGSYHCHHISDWGVVAVASSTSIELGVLGLSVPPPGYTQWTLEDDGRAEIPLHKNEECYPVGIAMDLTAAQPTPVGESFGPASPLLYLLSSSGLLCPYYCVNSKPGAPVLTCSREAFPEGERQGSVTLPTVQPVQPVITQPPQPPPVAAVAPAIPALTAASKPLAFSPTTSTPVQDKAKTLQFSFLSESKPVALASKAEVTAPPVQSKETAASEKALKGQGVNKTLFGSDDSPATAFPLSKSSSGSSQDSNPVSDVTNSKINAAIDEEYEAFEAELEKLRKNLKNLKCVVGSEEDKVTICSGVEQCSKFCRDILETTECQNSEIFALRASTLETFSWLEEAVARDRSGVEHKYQQLLRARPLDPRSARMMDKLRSQLFYCEQQVEEVGTVLDSQWEDHVTKLKRNLKGERSNVLEELSSAVVNNHKILDRQEDKVEDLQLRMRTLQARYPLTMGGAGRSPVKSKAETELDKLAASLREKSKLSPSTKSPAPAQKTVSTPRTKLNLNVTSPVAALSPQLDRSIREALDNRPLTVIKPQPRESPSKTSSAALLEKLKQSAPLISPEKTKSKQVVYEPISPVSPEKNEKFTSSLPAFGSSISTGSSVSKPTGFPPSKPGVGFVTAPAISQPVPSVPIAISSNASLRFGFSSTPATLSAVTSSSLTPSAKPAQPSGFSFSGFAPPATSKAPALSSGPSAFAPTKTTAMTSVSSSQASSTQTSGSNPPSSLTTSKISAFTASVPSSLTSSTAHQTTTATDEKAKSGTSTPASQGFAFSGEPKQSAMPSTQLPLFGASAQKTTVSVPNTSTLPFSSSTPSSVFGIGAGNKTVSSTTTTSASAGVFGQSKPSEGSTTTTASSSVFGGISSSASNSSVFGIGGANKTITTKDVPPTASSAGSSASPSPFATSSAPNKSIFGSTTVTTAGSAFAPSVQSSSSSGTTVTTTAAAGPTCNQRVCWS